jgi:hypothetical protein
MTEEQTKDYLTVHFYTRMNLQSHFFNKIDAEMMMSVALLIIRIQLQDNLPSKLK